jgi:hypothetical protein
MHMAALMSDMRRLKVPPAFSRQRARRRILHFVFTQTTLDSIAMGPKTDSSGAMMQRHKAKGPQAQ